MAFKLAKNQIEDLREHSKSIGKMWGLLEDETREATEKIDPILEGLIEERRKYTEAVEEAKSYIEGIASDLMGEFDDKSEKWQDGDRGQIVREWISDLENRAAEPETDVDDSAVGFELEMPQDWSEMFDPENFETEPEG